MKISIIIYAAVLSLPAFAQNDTVYIRETINNLFDGMREGDSAKVHRAFDDQVVLYTSHKNKEGQTVLDEGSLTGFLHAVGSTHDKIWDEQVNKISILIDESIAHVWTEYTFYLGEKRSHCGVNSFQLHKTNSGWKIIHLMDTRRFDCKE